MNSIRLELEGCQTQSLNVTQRIHFQKRHRQDKVWRDIIQGRLGRGPWPKTPNVKVPKPIYKQMMAQLRAEWPEPLRIRLEILERRPRLLDPDNFIGGLKALIDAVKNVGWLYDDSPEWLELEASQELCKKKPPAIVITITFPKEDKPGIAEKIADGLRRLKLWLKKEGKEGE